MPIGRDSFLKLGLKENIAKIEKNIYAVISRFRIGNNARSGNTDERIDWRIIAIIGPIIKYTFI